MQEDPGSAARALPSRTGLKKKKKRKGKKAKTALPTHAQTGSALTLPERSTLTSFPTRPKGGVTGLTEAPPRLDV